MPDDQSNNQTNNQSSNQSDNSSSGAGAVSGKKIVLGGDGGSQKSDLDKLQQIFEGAGNTVVQTPIGPNQESYMRGQGADMAVYFVNGVAPATWWSFVQSIKSGQNPYTMFAHPGFEPYHNLDEKDSPLASMENGRAEPYEPEHDAGQFMNASSTSQMQSDGGGVKTAGEYADANSQYICICWGASIEELGQNIVNGTCGAGGSGSVGGNSGGGAQIKDKTFEKCIRRICAATDSIFLVENNAAVLFPYTDWMAFTLRQKINTIGTDEIDPNIFTVEYGNEGFYNKVSIAWGGEELPERFPKDDEGNKLANTNNATNYTMQDILKNMSLTKFVDNTTTETTNNIVNKKNKTTQEITSDEDGNMMLSEQYDSLVKKYGEMEKRVESAAPDFETAQYIVNALLIQYIRDFNNSCKCRALNVRRYVGGTFYAVKNPFDESSEIYYLNSYNVRTQKDAPMYHDLDFKYGPEGAEEILDYQTLSGGAASGGTTTSSGSATEEAIWQDAAKCKWAQDQPDCSTNDPDTAKKHYDEYTAKGEEVHFDCFGMSAYLYGRFNNEAKIPCQVVGDNNHKVVMLDRGSGFVSTADEYRKYKLDYLFKWRENQNTTVLLPAPGSSGSTSGGNTNSNNTNGGNR